VKLTHPNRNTPQYAYSERDVEYLERNGWVREPVVKEQRPTLTLPKRGRPKVKP
jgi:hypothetical protein